MKFANKNEPSGSSRSAQFTRTSNRVYTPKPYTRGVSSEISTARSSGVTQQLQFANDDNVRSASETKSGLSSRGGAPPEDGSPPAAVIPQHKPSPSIMSSRISSKSFYIGFIDKDDKEPKTPSKPQKSTPAPQEQFKTVLPTLKDVEEMMVLSDFFESNNIKASDALRVQVSECVRTRCAMSTTQREALEILRAARRPDSVAI
ncbi:hypothetical protein VTN77DRAFT_9886 [Rasamsonia byssochlamydoides]|uniref:uncharacterized protein n=1 Tax=Rasamsonia byssochlamydoides TaxID=89139 RepID=UPI0037426414